MRRSTEMLALDGISQFGLAELLLVTGNAEEAGAHFSAATDLSRRPDTAAFLAVEYASETGDYDAGIDALSHSRLRFSNAKTLALMAGFRAMVAANAAAKQSAIAVLLALPQAEHDMIVARLLAALGANREALGMVERAAPLLGFWTTSTLWYPSMRSARSDPAFPALVQRLGLTKYWRASGTRPDACREARPPPFCKAIRP